MTDVLCRPFHPSVTLSVESFDTVALTCQLSAVRLHQRTAVADNLSATVLI